MVQSQTFLEQNAWLKKGEMFYMLLYCVHIVIIHFAKCIFAASSCSVLGLRRLAGQRSFQFWLCSNG